MATALMPYTVRVLYRRDTNGVPVAKFLNEGDAYAFAEVVRTDKARVKAPHDPLLAVRVTKGTKLLTELYPQTFTVPEGVVSTVGTNAHDPRDNSVVKWSGLLPVPELETVLRSKIPYFLQPGNRRVEEGTALQVEAYQVEHGWLYLVCSVYGHAERVVHVAGVDLEPQGVRKFTADDERWASEYLPEHAAKAKGSAP